MVLGGQRKVELVLILLQTGNAHQEKGEPLAAIRAFEMEVGGCFGCQVEETHTQMWDFSP
jgi:hypothetical protein